MGKFDKDQNCLVQFDLFPLIQSGDVKIRALHDFIALHL